MAPRGLTGSAISRQRNALGPAPEIFERVVIASFGVEQVDHDGAIVEQNPTALVVSFDAHSQVAHIPFQNTIDFLANGMQLPAAIASDEKKVIELGRHAPHVKENDILPVVVLGRARGRQSELETALSPQFGGGGCTGDYRSP